jgi:ParB-like chromosome segregation protein Spo0J
MTHPIDNVTWVDAKLLRANDYNPNVVFKQELKLLEHSIIKNGWIQPILVTQDYVIIDGFHRWSLALKSEIVPKLTNGKVPVVIMNLTEPERMMLTIRINRAKGAHIAVKMSDIIKQLVRDYGLTLDEIAKEIGATKAEIEVLMMDDVFKKLKIDEHEYSNAWIPHGSKEDFDG